MNRRKGGLAILFLALTVYLCGGLQAEAKGKEKFQIKGGRTIYKVGEEFRLVASGEQALGTIRWSSSNKKVAVVSSEGMVTVRRAGKCQVTAVNKKNQKARFTFYAVNYSIPDTTQEDVVTVTVQSDSGKTYSYHIFNQMSGFKSYSQFLTWHGCACCSLTTLLGSRVRKLQNYTPDQTIGKIEKSVFSKGEFKRNYGKKLKLQRPVSLNGIAKILSKYKIRYKYVASYTKKKAKSQIEAHLLKGKPVLIVTRKGKWAYSYHTMLLIGMTRDGKAIVADSANRKWAGKNQRIKYAKVSELLKSMWSGRRSGSVYWNGYSGSGGYMLIY